MGLVTDHLSTLECLPGGNLVLTRIDEVINWARSNSLWPLSFGTSCCAIEMMMATGSSHFDIARFGAEVVRPSPRQADLLIIAGTIVKRMASRLRALYEQMAEPKYVIATGSCTISGGPFLYHSYTTVRGADEIIPVDVYVPGCPPRPEALFYGLLTLQRMIKEGETVRKPGIRKKPITAALPEGITKTAINEQMNKLLAEIAQVNIREDALDKPWAKKEDKRL